MQCIIRVFKIDAHSNVDNWTQSFFFLKFGAMHFIYQINRLTTTKVDSTYLG